MPFKLGTFYLAGNRNFLLGSDTRMSRLMPDDALDMELLCDTLPSRGGAEWLRNLLRISKMPLYSVWLLTSWQMIPRLSRPNAASWPSEKVFETIRAEFASFGWCVSVNVLNFTSPATITRLQFRWRMRDLKDLFPIYDEKSSGTKP